MKEANAPAYHVDQKITGYRIPIISSLLGPTFYLVGWVGQFHLECRSVCPAEPARFL